MTMPNFLIVGAQKAGTTSLYYYLKQHPQVYMSPRKEPHFFAGMQYDSLRRPVRKNGPVTDPEDYRALFEGVTDEKAVGEASASYLYSPRSADLIKRSIPDARLIVILRNPADRAYSNYLHCVRTGREPLSSFSEALRAEDGRIRDMWGPLWHYRRKGFYYEQVKRYFDTFDRSQVTVLLYDDMRADPLGVLRDVFGFLGVDETFAPDMSIEHNTSGLPKNKALYVFAKRLAARNPALKLALLEKLLPAERRRRLKSRVFAKPPSFDPEIRAELIEGYREDVLKLQEFLGRDLSTWLSPRPQGVSETKVSAED